MNKDHLETLASGIVRGLEFLQRSQLPSGEFPVYVSPDLTMEGNCVLDESPCSAQFVAYSLSFSNAPVAREMITKSLVLMRAAMEPCGVWRYWPNWPQPGLYGWYVPTDVDDTACISYLLRHYGDFDPRNQAVLLANRSPKKLFYTWYVPRLMWVSNLNYWRVTFRDLVRPRQKFSDFWKTLALSEDVDGVINANVLFYLGEKLSPAPVIDYLIDIVARKAEDTCDRWYSLWMFHYALSRCYWVGIEKFEVVHDEMVARILAEVREDGSIGNHPFVTALALCSLFNWKVFPKQTHRAIEFLLSAQGPEGQWPGHHIFFNGPQRDCGFGSAEITTGLCIEALTRYETELNRVSTAM